jgi:NADH-quinone oxidoreductase subunit C
MSFQTILDQLKQRFGDGIASSDLEALDPWIEVAPASLVEVCRFLRDGEGMEFNLLNCVSAVDYFEPDPKKAKKAKWQPHLEVLYHLSSTTKKHMLVLMVQLPRWKEEVEGQLPELPSVSGVWNTANWHEREVFDLMGVSFSGHPELHRILCPEDWVGHPLRKDYQMPLEYHGIRGN